MLFNFWVLFSSLKGNGSKFFFPSLLYIFFYIHDFVVFYMFMETQFQSLALCFMCLVYVPSLVISFVHLLLLWNSWPKLDFNFFWSTWFIFYSRSIINSFLFLLLRIMKQFNYKYLIMLILLIFINMIVSLVMMSL